ncbi:MAG: dihydrolipoyl dehydrogenase [Alphaproteobacteria bacterium]|nr:dihydrolipoyl dehydrogenase [Alphaproteobacteria bacterium]
MADNAFDLIIIGSGPGGYVAAIRAAQLGLKTAIVEREHLGGICLNWGCIPTKALLRSSEIYHYIKDAASYGLSVSDVKADFFAIIDRSRKVSGKLNAGVGGLLKKNGVHIIWGEAQITSPNEIQVSAIQKKPVEPQNPVPRSALGYGHYFAKNIIVASGARPRFLPGINPDNPLIWTYFDSMKPEALPGSIAIIGSGAIGIEFASFYSSMGTLVTVVEVLDRILPAEDEDISLIVRKQLEARGLEIMTGVSVDAVREGTNDVTLEVIAGDGKPRKIVVDRLILAIGVVGNIENLGLEACGVETANGCIVVDGYGRTNIPCVHAIGDVAGPPMLAHKAEHEGIVCVEKIAGLQNVKPLNKDIIPGCIYCSPQVASVGLNEKKARDAGYELKIGKFPFFANGKAIALGEQDGLVKTIFDASSGQLLGAHMVGAEVTELIQGFVIAMNLETTEQELMHSVFPHPTLSETMHESVMDAYGRVIHK